MISVSQHTEAASAKYVYPKLKGKRTTTHIINVEANMPKHTVAIHIKMDLLINSMDLALNNRYKTQQQKNTLNNRNESRGTKKSHVHQEQGRQMGRCYLVASYLCAKIANHIAQMCS